MSERKMVTVGTYGAMLKHGYRLFINCEDCDHKVEFDLTSMPPDASSIRRRYKCVVCGGRGRSIMLPPGNKEPNG